MKKIQIETTSPSAINTRYAIRGLMITVALFTVAAPGCKDPNVILATSKVSYVNSQKGPVLSNVTPAPPPPSTPPKDPFGPSMAAFGTSLHPAGPAGTGQECDVCVNGVSNCGGPCGGGSTSTTTCGAPGQCSCSLGSSALIGHCDSRSASEACTFCPFGTTSSDPCGPYCEVFDESRAPPQAVKLCPTGYPNPCKGDVCCPSSHPACCPDQVYCGGNLLDCRDNDPDYDSRGTSSSGGSSSSGGGGGSAFDCSPRNAEVTCRTVTTCSQCSVSSCGGPNGSGCAFVKTSDGQVYPGLSPNGQNTLTEASQSALKHCGCTG